MKEDKLAVNQYINKQPESVSIYLNQLRKIITSELPSAIEGIAWAMPSYWDGKYLAHFDAYKDHVNVYFYLAPQIINEFSKKYPHLSFTKRGLQCFFNQELPKTILIEMLQWQNKKVKENETR